MKYCSHYRKINKSIQGVNFGTNMMIKKQEQKKEVIYLKFGKWLERYKFTLIM